MHLGYFDSGFSRIFFSLLTSCLLFPVGCCLWLYTFDLVCFGSLCWGNSRHLVFGDVHIYICLRDHLWPSNRTLEE
jgi:hypothetical protein